VTSPTPPSVPPTTASAVIEWLALTKQTSTPEEIAEAEAKVADYVAATNTLVARWCTPDEVTGEWGPEVHLGARMLAGRLYRRRNNPAGVADFGAEGGPVFVQRNDPDIAALLRIGSYTPPRVG
jgi:hypothetical protein